MNMVFDSLTKYLWYLTLLTMHPVPCKLKITTTQVHPHTQAQTYSHTERESEWVREWERDVALVFASCYCISKRSLCVIIHLILTPISWTLWQVFYTRYRVYVPIRWFLNGALGVIVTSVLIHLDDLFPSISTTTTYQLISTKCPDERRVPW